MTGPMATIDRLVRATNQHDLESMAACFSEDYHNETPAHPARGFRGRAQVRRNWGQIFAFVPDIHVEVLRSAAMGDTVWTEWEMRGTRLDGAPHLMRGVSIFKVAGDEFTSVRFYLEPVEQAGAGIDAAVRSALGR